MIIKDIDKRNLAMNRENFQATSGTGSHNLASFHYDSSNTGFKVISDGYDKRFQFNNQKVGHYYFIYCEYMVETVNTDRRTIWLEGFDQNYRVSPSTANVWYTFKTKVRAVNDKYETTGAGIRFYGGFSLTVDDPGYINGSFTTHYKNVVIVDMGTEDFDIDTVDYRDYLNKSYLVADKNQDNSIKYLEVEN